jgi:hypothetical protein
MAHDSSLTPSKFSGGLSENAEVFLKKYEDWCVIRDIRDNNRIHSFILLLSGPCESWYMLLADNQKDTYAHLRAAFLQRYGNANQSVVNEEMFYNARQANGQPVTEYADLMQNLGCKLQLNAHQILATIKRGLLPHYRMHILSRQIDDIQALIQICCIVDTYQPTLPANASSLNVDNSQSGQSDHNKKTTQQIDELKQGTVEIKNMVGNLAKMFDQMKICAVEQTSDRSKPQSPTQYRSNNSYSHNNNKQFGNNQQKHKTTNRSTGCWFCGLTNHIQRDCRKRKNAQFRNAPRMGQFPQYPGQFSQFTGQMQYAPMQMQYAPIPNANYSGQQYAWPRQQMRPSSNMPYQQGFPAQAIGAVSFQEQQQQSLN